MDLQAYGWNGKIWNGRFGEQKKKGNLIMRKFNLKKIAAFVLAGTMAIGMSATVFAADLSGKALERV